jgi:hypothetical protein
MRDLDLQLQERLHPQEQESWDDDNHPTYVPPVKPWWKKTEKKEEKSGVHPTRFFLSFGSHFFKKIVDCDFNEEKKSYQLISYDLSARVVWKHYDNIFADSILKIFSQRCIDMILFIKIMILFIKIISVMTSMKFYKMC